MTGNCGDVAVSAPYPNPVSVGPVKVDLQSACAKRVSWSVYTPANRKILESAVNVSGKTTVMWNLTDAKGERVAAGLYYLVFAPEGQKRRVCKVFVEP